MARRKRLHWTLEEDEKLRQAINSHNGRNWKLISKTVFDGDEKNHLLCARRWQCVLNPKINKDPWTPQEDRKLKRLVLKMGTKNWSAITTHLPGRLGKQCSSRWYNHVNPEINKDPWTHEEDLIILKIHRELGNRWTDISKFLKNRPANAIKNHWHSSIKKKYYEISEDVKLNECEQEHRQVFFDNRDFSGPSADSMYSELGTVAQQHKEQQEDISSFFA